MTVVAPPTAELREPIRDGPDALMKEARERQRRRRQRLALLLLLLGGIGGIGYGIDRGWGGHSSSACAASACTGAGAVASGAAPLIVSVVSEPSGRRLSPGSLKIVPGKREQGLNVVPAPVNLAFKVTLHNGSASWERNVEVTLTVYRSARRGHGPMIGHPSFRATTVQTQHARAIGPNETEVLRFSKRLLVPFATATRIKVDVTAARSGKLTAKRTRSYPVIFSLP